MDIVISIASKIAESLVTPIGREFGYLIYYDTNMKDLKDELKQLFEMKDGVQELVNAAKRNGEVINSDVQSWLTSVNKLIQKVSHFEEEVSMKRRCLYRWNISRKATKITQDVRHLQKERTFNNNVAHPAPPPMIWSTFKEGFKDFKSRMTCVNSVIEVLKNEEVRMIGICGMGGVGKTTMVKEIIKRLAGLKVFDNVVMAVVSQSPSIRKIQSEIADELGFTYDREDSETGRARRLYGRLKQINKILIVLDDVWTELDFEAIGLPYGPHKGCKVLLTSRNLEVCNAMGSQEIFTIPVLTPEESWELFREMVGEPLDYPDLAKQVTNECGGLPIAIITVAKALENKRKHEWVDALKQLQSSAPESIPSMNDRVYSNIRWSYDRLESDEAKSCLLLCSLFPEDYDIPIEYLVRYGWGRGYFSNIDSVDEARNRVHSLVDKLQRRFLLLDSERKDHTKMHDIVRDVAISIASRDPHRFLIRNDAKKKGWPEKYDHCTTISLIPINIYEIPVGLECPKLELLHLEDEHYSLNSMENDMCEGMKKLKVLGMGGISALPSSLGVLKSLRTLSLNGCRYLTDISDVIGRLENLEILSFRNCSRILELPREIGLLKHLRLLDITDCYNLEKIPHGLLSSLSSLEELYMENSFRKWERSAAESEDKRMASLVEVMSLSNHLKVLVIDIPNFNFFPKYFYLTIQTTIRFHISNQLGFSTTPSTIHGCYAFENKLDIVKSDATEFMEIQIVRLLFKKCEDLLLGEIKNLKHVLNELDQEGLRHLKVLTIRNCPEIEYLVNGASWIQQTAFPLIQSIELIGMPKLKAICHDQLPQSSFINLRSLVLSECPVLKYAFSLSVASNLVQLQSLLVSLCHQMKEIVSKEWREDETAFVGFPKLTNLTLWGISNEFVGFYEANKLYSNHEVTTPKDQNVVGTSYDVHQSSRSFERAVFPSKCILWLQNLEEVELYNANVDVLFDLKGHMVPAFSHLRKLEILLESPCQHLWKNIPCGFQGFQNLRYLKIEDCRDLEELNIAECRKMETIVRSADENEKEDQTGMTLFPKLNSFDLNGLRSLESLCPDASTSLWSAAKVMSVQRCDKLKTLVSVIPQIKKLEKDSTAHHEDEDEGISSGSCGCTPYSCGPMTEPTSRRNVVQILPRPVNQEVAPTNLDQDSNDYDNLERLSVLSCESLEVVFQLKGPKAVESHNVQAFNKLCYLSLNYLPSLMHVWETGGSQHITGFGNLTFLGVSDCGSLRYLFLSTVAKLLVSLKDLKVGNCEKIEQVIAKADTECADQEITFPQLNSMRLENLPNLICFSTEAYTLKLPSLMELTVERCPDLRTFASKVVNTHPRIQVHTWLGKSEWMGDLNSTIGNIHEKRETQRSAEHVDEEDEFSSEEYNEEQVDEEVNTDSTE
ncbi:disease resistance protein At4g27190-like [Prunus avium]|uniref:Disease resistance protein At4g27190-like n=1 Tax=Prunus avium TaxID=42229 RepID=A0A6P5RXS3_PRUAV|nr:disease resistance protein At4g27190-like [Prunus avium]XP_021807367.1 disease resistance protein At4g27190-like [Prunus avium]XP_021807442.1 disease resistance protein At4g27190-like [Prunus avium]XP_021807501.1 disease resistance protein At4g27190-like [Prunus avium]